MYAFFDRFYPHILDVIHGKLDHWETQGTQLYKKSTGKLCLFYVYEGLGVMELDGHSYPLAEGSIAQIPVKRKLIIRNSPPGPLRYFMIEYDYKLIKWQDEPTGFEESPEKRLPFDLVVPMMDHRGLRSDMQLLYRVWSERQEGYSGQAKLLFYQLILRIGEQLVERQKDDSAERSIMDCVNYINNHYHESLEREQLARKVSLSRSYFSVLFKKYVGCSPVEYITRVRLDKAMQLLRGSNKSVSVVALEVGFHDPLYFSRVFTREIGVTPRDYREA
ncbi:helix-turn-helix transcriptional regulator [Cohnella herbarum]|uniref:Helix-turn-helix transcriptional regulator n=1 Tax=Cohnella herbarum TaxID=2728023 RepID=A0A7Z2VFJ4_9BACL|nr:AraC family transcriptional regulator [Cohnella herbarum]QJD82015.1 helix-turn-helix transcriptional regulator [Cohnella herbarum]